MLAVHTYNPADRDLLQQVACRLRDAGMVPAAICAASVDQGPGIRAGWLLGVDGNGIHVYHAMPTPNREDLEGNLGRYGIALIEHFAVTRVESAMPQLPPFLLVRPLEVH